MITVLLIALFLYALLAIITALGNGIRPQSKLTDFPLVSIVIVAKDEAKFLPACLESLAKLSYPKDKLEIMLVDDRSEDATYELMQNFVNGHSNAKILRMETVPSGYTGKTNGLIQGIGKCNGELLFITDADGEVPPNWIQSMLRGLDENIGLIGGYVQTDTKEEKGTLFSRLQSIDWIFISTIASGWANVGYPISVFGNNFFIRREVYQEHGGFQAVKDQVLEDFALVQKLRKKATSAVRVYLDKDSTITTQPVTSWAEFFSQRRRWSVGSRPHGFQAYLLMAGTFMAHLTTILAFPLQGIVTGFMALGFLVFFDFLMLIRPLKVLRRFDLLPFLPLYELFYFGYTIFFASFFLFGRTIKWKDSHLPVHASPKIKKPMTEES
jgi:cellulose synthase/poly-beta-1,6-N-acetylglucosamine synthase-like glycosyltransferase